MSEQAGGENWWQASDGKWYPPEQHPDFVAGGAPPAPSSVPPSMPPPSAGPPPTAPFGSPAAPGAPDLPPPLPPVGAPLGAPPGGPPPGEPGATKGRGRGPIIGAAIVVAIIVIAAVVLLTRGGGSNKQNASTNSEQSSDSSDSTSTSSSSKKSSSSTSSSRSSSSAATQTFHDADNNIHVSVPSSFQQLDPSVLSTSASTSSNQLLSAFAADAPQLVSQSFIVGTGELNGEPVVIDVGAAAQQIDPSNSDEVETFNSAESAELGSSGTADTTTVQLPSGTALRNEITVPQGAQTVNLTEFFVNARGQTFVLIVSSVGENKNDAAVDQIAQTLSIT